MTLNFWQWLWVIACFALIASIFSDISGLIEIPPIYWLAGSAGLTVVGWRVMPMREIEAAWRKQNGR